jgi:hypothetical protein
VIAAPHIAYEKNIVASNHHSARRFSRRAGGVG